MSLQHQTTGCQGGLGRAQFVLLRECQYDWIAGAWTPPVELVCYEVKPEPEPVLDRGQGNLFRRHRQRSFEFVKECLAACHKEMRTWVCASCKKQFVTEYVCHSRICARCARARSMRMARKYGGLPYKWPVHVVMGLPVTRDLSAAISRSLPAKLAWREGYNQAVARQHKGIKRAAKAGCSAAEITAWFGRRLEPLGFGIYSVEPKPSGEGWFVHVHQLLECEWISKALAEACWREATSGAAWIVKIRRVGDKHTPKGKSGAVQGAVYEVCKYACKGLAGRGTKSLPEADLKMLYYATFNRRLIGAWGLPTSGVHTKEITSRFACECGGKLLPTGERLTFAQAFDGLLTGVISVLRLDSS